MMRIAVKRLADVSLPRYAHEGDAAFDLPAAQDMVVQPGTTALIPTGLALAIPDGFVGLVKDRSGLAAKHGLHCFAGVVDSGYRGEVKVVMHNHGKEPFSVEKGMRIAQLLVQQVHAADLVEVDELSASERSGKGFGSTGR